MTRNIDSKVTVTKVRRAYLAGYYRTWHIRLASLVARHYRMIVLVDSDNKTLYLAGAQTKRGDRRACKSLYRTLVTQIRKAGRSVPAQVRNCYYDQALADVSTELLSRHLPTITKQYFDKRAA